MSTNSLTLASVTGHRDDRDAAGMNRYHTLMRRALRATLNDDDQAADRYRERARTVAYRESFRGNLGPLIEHIERQL